MHTAMLQVLLIIYVYSAFAHPEGAYKIIVKRIEFVQQNEDFVRAVVITTRINRYTIAFNMHIQYYLKVDVSHNFKVTIRLYEFLNNEYRPFAVHILRSYCDFMEMEYKKFLYPDFIRIGAHMFEPKCPVLKIFPPGLPFHNGLSEIKIMNGTSAELTLHVYFILDRDIIFRERYS